MLYISVSWLPILRWSGVELNYSYSGYDIHSLPIWGSGCFVIYFELFPPTAEEAEEAGEGMGLLDNGRPAQM